MNHPRYQDKGEVDLPIAYGTGTLWFQGPGSDVRPDTVSAIKTAIRLGYHHLDGAQMYNTERELGAALADCSVSRADLFVTTKTTDLDHVEAALDQSLADLQTGYVDLYLIHHPFGARSPEHLQDAWRAMERCHQSGRARRIGVSSFAVRHLEILFAMPGGGPAVPPCVNQLEMHPYIQQDALLAYLLQKHIAVEGFAALTPLTADKTVFGTLPTPLDAVVHACAARYRVDPAAVLLRWVLDQGAVAITTSGKASRLAAYRADVASFTLTAVDIEAIRAAGARTPHRAFFAEEVAAEEQAQ